MLDKHVDDSAAEDGTQMIKLHVKLDNLPAFDKGRNLEGTCEDSGSK